jgi:ArsR family transcriptional regulator, arsenate/arsenite/antimonite-responsive transcriptional repressor
VSLEINPTEIFRALGDEHRWKILEFIARGDVACCINPEGVCGCDVQNVLGLAQATVSHHLKILVDAHLISSEKRGRWVYYRIEAHGAQVARHALETLHATSSTTQRPRSPSAPPDSSGDTLPH